MSLTSVWGSCGHLPPKLSTLSRDRDTLQTPNYSTFSPYPMVLSFFNLFFEYFYCRASCHSIFCAVALTNSKDIFSQIQHSLQSPWSKLCLICIIRITQFLLLMVSSFFNLFLSISIAGHHHVIAYFVRLS